MSTFESIEEFPVDFPSSDMSIQDYMTEMERLVRDHYSDSIRTLWINYSRISKGRREYRLQVTLFPHGVDHPYRIITGQVDTRLSISGVMDMIDGEMG